MSLTLPPTAPSTSDPSTFSSRADAHIAWLQVHTQELIDYLATLTSIAAGTAVSIPYIFSTTTTDSDPGAGKLRLDNSTQNLATTIRADLSGSDGTVWTSTLDYFDNSTSTVKGQIKLLKLGDSSKFIAMDVTAVAAPSGYRNITVSVVDYSSSNPFSDGDFIILLFTRTGDKGDTGPVYTHPYLNVRDEKSSGSHGGSAASADLTQTRDLNTVITNTIPSASVTTNTITLPTGTYEFKARVPAYLVGSHKASLYNQTDSLYQIVGSTAYSNTSSSIQTDSFIYGNFSIVGTKSFKIRHYTSSARSTDGLGYAVGASGLAEVYSEVEIWKIA